VPTLVLNIGDQQATAKVKIHAETDWFRIEKGIRQGDTISLHNPVRICIELDNKGNQPTTYALPTILC